MFHAGKISKIEMRCINFKQIVEIKGWINFFIMEKGSVLFHDDVVSIIGKNDVTFYRWHRTILIMIYMWSDLLVHNDCLNNIIIRQKKMEKQTVFYACAFVYYRCQKKREPDQRKRGTQNEKGVTRILSMFL